MREQRELSSLRAQNESLQRELAAAQAVISSFTEATSKGMLPLKGVECTGCKHCFFYYGGGSTLAIACDKDIACKDFEASEHTVKRYAGAYCKDHRVYGKISIDLNQQY